MYVPGALNRGPDLDVWGWGRLLGKGDRHSGRCLKGETASSLTGLHGKVGWPMGVSWRHREE